MIRHVLAGALVVLALPALAAEVTSAQPGRVAVTLYQSYFVYPDVAQISETRSVTLPAGDNVIHFEGVASTLIPQTARVEGLPDTPRSVDFDYALFDAATVLNKSIGSSAEFIQSPAKGPEIRRVGRLVSQQGIVAFEDENGVESFGCGGPPARLVVDVPPGLRSTPALSVRVQTRQPGRYAVRLSYLAEKIRWRAVYVAKIGGEGRRIDLEGRIVLENGSTTSFDRAPTRFVVGNAPRLGGTRAPWIGVTQPGRECWGTGRTSDPIFDRRREATMFGADVGMTVATGSAVRAPAASLSRGRDVALEDLGDLKLFRLEEPMRIAALQQKLFTFMSARAVKAEPFFLVPFVGTQSVEAGYARQGWRVNNTKAAGLGKPLPHGSVTLYQGSSAYLGVNDIPLGISEGGHLELTGGPSGEVMFDHQIVADRKDGNANLRTRSMVLTNTSQRPVTVEFRLPQTQVKSVLSGLDKVIAKNGAYVWITQLSAHERRNLTVMTSETN